jgi:hypothetical protein
MMSAHCVRVQRGTEQLVLANLKTVQAAHRLVALAAHASLMIVQHAHVVKMARHLVLVAQMIVRHAQEEIAIVRHAQEEIAIDHRAQEVSMSVRPVVVVRHLDDQQKVVVVQPRVAVGRVKVVVVQQRVVVVRVKVVVARLLAGRQRVVVGQTVMMIVQ